MDLKSIKDAAQKKAAKAKNEKASKSYENQQLLALGSKVNRLGILYGIADHAASAEGVGVKRRRIGGPLGDFSGLAGEPTLPASGVPVPLSPSKRTTPSSTARPVMPVATAF